MDYSGRIHFTTRRVGQDRVEGNMPVHADILNPFGVVHAGAILWFADVCATVLVSGGAELVAGGAGFPLGVALTANLLGNQRAGELRATSVFVRRGRRLSVVRTTVTGDGDRLIADVTTSHVPAEPAAR
jgi:uncharacterized protein (TIGR00369 family)